MSYREKEWDEPGPDFGKVYRRPARRIIQARPACKCDDEVARQLAETDDKSAATRDRIRWAAHSTICLGGNK
ncbi:hypothetical protein MYRNA_49 [Mycobacterium phage Myrna]|uniref:Uncharacterized protein n=1 Tax=Mycobacterium phage Myrna TaxID=546805 RepID=B5LJ60_9CAUD|nr:gp49 [Mycobacterium phage Myrna]ACH62057.1 hypothetical protein MYRNA_49 [Mycobacterium phage Myrna]